MRKEPSWYASKEWAKARAKTKSAWKAANRACGVCHQPLEWTVKHAVIVDHILNRRQRPDLAYESTNLQCVCHGCNTRKAHYVENNKSRVSVGVDGLNALWRL